MTEEDVAGLPSHARPPRFPGSVSMTAIGAGDDFEQMPVRVFEIDAAAAVVVVDLSRVLLERIRPVLEASLADAPEHAVEIVLPDEEGVVLRSDVAVLA